MALFSYQRRVQRLLRDQRVQLINPSDLTAYINEARGQISGEAQSVLTVGTLAITPAAQVYRFNSVVLPTGYAGPLNVRTIWYGIGAGQLWITPRSWPWFSLYELSNPAPTPGPPKVWAQYGQGDGGLGPDGGSIYVSPVPDTNYALTVDAVCRAAVLENDTDTEVLPYPWTDAVAYYATYLAMLSMQTGGSTAESDKMYQRYEQYMARARSAATPNILPTTYAQSPNPVRANQIGMAPQQRGGQ